ncbi:MAG: S1 domain-containing RNA-binding protein [Bombilactobacillus mellifer]|uniref:S1 domain-containing RNA-binding protein n=1 Tax=Bombilactobacillus mellifer TaxID=1218492 RepID=UPI0018DDFDBC|nr:S1 domain-containing RNA-binding protein [Bombilactobacillus mellifer]MBH9991759.1 RNA-binding protein S1 [Lactobacillus sp. W8092]MCT6826101.1 S1 domain-containing RNA-binding protein [Bombilactobacillus mellifer]MCT6843609.1 S1 domain-containing RNA-binding protein [Bombilactobacillus mellifer]MCT6893979.1 S1 domain-containing RNA-binding protein [Bombilactobacillus mellifer]
MTVSVGTKVTGKVTGIKDFGAFVDLGDGQSGLVHISQISNDYVKDIHDKLSVGDTVTAMVVNVEHGKIALSIKQAEKPASKNHHSHPHHQNRTNNNYHHSNKKDSKDDFDTLLAGFMKESQDRLSTLKKNTEGKRGGRGGRRS